MSRIVIVHDKIPMPKPSANAIHQPSLRMFIDTYFKENGRKPTSREMFIFYDANPEIFEKETGQSLNEANKRIKGGRRSCQTK
jgi:hypothetical protein